MKIKTTAIASALAILLVAPPASGQAFNFNLNRFLDGLFNSLERFVFDIAGQELQDFLTDLLGDETYSRKLARNLSSTSIGVLEDAVRDLASGSTSAGYLSVRADAYNKTRDLGNNVFTGLHSTLEGKFAETQTVAALTDAHIESVLGEVGSQTRQDQIDAVNDINQRVEAAARAAEGHTVTQDVMKELVRIQAGQTAFISQMRLEQLQQRIDSAHTNAALVDLPQMMLQQQRKQAAIEKAQGMSALSDSVVAANSWSSTPR